MKPLNIREFPLTGTSLIEASAGTGKTYTIASLYSRLVLGHQTGYQPLRTDQILVVTFTNAATEELRGRIRERLRENLEQLLYCQAGMAVTDSDYLTWLQDLALVDDQPALEEKTQWLQANLSLMDSASVFTIHGFAQRMLKQFAFDAGILFDSELMMETGKLLTTASEDVWRRLLYPQSQSRVSFFKGIFSSPDRLKKRVRTWLSRPDLQILPELPSEMPSDSEGDVSASGDDEAWEKDWRQVEASFDAIKSDWRALGAASIGDVIRDSGVSKRSYSNRNLPRWLGILDDWLAGERILPVPDEVKRFGSAQLEAATPEGKSAPSHPLFDGIDRLLVQADRIQARVPHWCLFHIKKRFAELLEQSSALSPDDLLRFLDRALNDPLGDGQKADLLALQIRRLYPIALIDEFQDTDSLQFRIFSKIYPDQTNAQSTLIPRERDGEPVQGAQGATTRGEVVHEDLPHGLVAIGDPKQAIYGFRGADIYTYIQARRSLSDERIFTLATNWRSHSGLIQGVNQLFESHPAPFVLDQDIPFHPVKASGKKDGLHLLLTHKDTTQSHERLPSPLTIWTHSEPCSVSQGRALAARQCAGQISALIRGAGVFSSAESGTEMALESSAETPVVAGDIAVLVRSHDQAALMKRALAEQGVGSVLLSKESVFESREASDLLLWLSAVAHPNQESRIRTAIATGTQGYSLSELESIQTDSERWDEEVRHFFSYQKNASQQGIMSALMRWLNQGSRAARLASGENGERRLTNLLHLGELLQGASRRLSGLVRLHTWLDENIREAISDGGVTSEQSQLRLETDANLVSIVTIHKSKGLEYPLVFLPFLWGDDFTRTDSSQSVYFDASLKRLVAHQAPDKRAKERAMLDSQAEAMRLLYVALTRACQGCFLWVVNAGSASKKSGWSPVLHKSAFGQLLGSEQLDFGLVDVGAADKDSAPDIAAQLAAHFGGQTNSDAAHTGDASETSALGRGQGLGIIEFEPWADSAFDQRLLPDATAATNAKDAAGKSAIIPASFNGLAYDPWQLSSFSQLIGTQSSGASLELLQSDEEARTDQKLIEFSPVLFAPQSPSLPPTVELDSRLEQETDTEIPEQADRYPDIAFDFPRGASAGTCLHAILERWDFGSSEALLDIAEVELARYGIDLGAGAGGLGMDSSSLDTPAWKGDLTAWFRTLTHCPLKDAYGHEFSLSAIDPSSRLDELEFYLPVDSLVPSEVDRLLNQSDFVCLVNERKLAQSVVVNMLGTGSEAETGRLMEEVDSSEPDTEWASFGSEQRAALDFHQLKGFLKGFIDLVFEYQGRYYLLDYKSNYLGDSVEAYDQRAMQSAMYSHHYDLQAWIYTLALDRYLTVRIPNYDPEQHLGGVFYLFLRGMSGARPVGNDACPTEAPIPEFEHAASVAKVDTLGSVPVQADLFELSDTDKPESSLFGPIPGGVSPNSSHSAGSSSGESYRVNQPSGSTGQPSRGQCFGVYYQTIEKEALMQWRQLFGISDAEHQEAGS